MRKLSVNNPGKNTDSPREMAFRQKNKEENAYYDEFQACKKSWTLGAIWGVLVGTLLGFLFSGFQFDDIFFGMSILMSVSCTITFATLFGIKYTEGFGCSCIPISLFSGSIHIVGFFAGTYVLLWVAALLLCVFLGLWLLGFLIFAALFPIETLYYAIRYSIEKKSIRSSMTKTRLAAA